METYRRTVLEFLEGWKIFKIPVFQRNYSWTIDNCSQLFLDIENILISGKEHFIGTIVYKRFEDGIISSHLVVDGQQRLTTIQLLVKAMCDIEENTFNVI